MPENPSSRHILIDFENVPSTDLGPIAGLPVEVTLLIGEKNKQLKVDFVAQLLAAESRVHLVQVGASGRNALDLTLAYYFGKAAAEHPRAEFFIVSKDADYDPMIEYVKRRGVCVSRHGSVAELPFVEKPAAQPKPTLEAGRLQAYAQKLRKGPAPRDLTALRKKIQNDFKKHIGPDGVDAVVDWLKREKVVEVSPDEKVKVLLAT